MSGVEIDSWKANGKVVSLTYKGGYQSILLFNFKEECTCGNRSWKWNPQSCSQTINISLSFESWEKICQVKCEVLLTNWMVCSYLHFKTWKSHIDCDSRYYSAACMPFVVIETLYFVDTPLTLEILSTIFVKPGGVYQLFKTPFNMRKEAV